MVVPAHRYGTMTAVAGQRPTASPGSSRTPIARPSTRRNGDDARADLWALPVGAVYAALGTRPDGLGAEEAAARRLRYGPNEIPAARQRPLVLRFVDELAHVMAILLWAAGAMAFVAGQPALGWAIWAVVVINGVFSFWQEYRAERALAELRRLLPVKVRICRDGQVGELQARDVVPGDVIRLEEGDRIAADARLVSAVQLSIDQSTLTGESSPVPRFAEPAPGPAGSPVDVPNLVLAGTTVATGRGIAVAYATGPHTEFGRVAHLTETVRREPSTLEVEVARTAEVISVLALTTGFAVFLLATIFVGIGPQVAFVFAIGIVVANVPEGLLPTVTLALAIGVQRMARRNALVRRLSAVETLSAATVICTDKTGTLTRNEMTVTRLWTSPVATDLIRGGRYGPVRDVAIPGPAERRRSLLMLLGAATLCSNARLTMVDGRLRVLGDPTEGALVAAGGRVGLTPEALEAAAPREREIPFDSRRKLMTVVLRWQLADLWHIGAPYMAISKGALSEVLPRCGALVAQGAIRPLTDDDLTSIKRAHDRLAADGLRIIAVAYREGGRELIRAPIAEVESNLTFLGFAAMWDPPREEVPDAIVACAGAGIRVTMITGDDGRTAEAIGRRIGLAARGGTVVEGQQLDRMSALELHELLRSLEPVIFARVSPEHKLRIVQAYQELGHVVAVTGDGVNDAPALRAANIGIAMGISGTDVAREAADVVLLDDNFATIVAAVEQSRAIYRNLRKFFPYVLASNVPELVPFVAMLVAGVPAALTIMQILAVDLGTDLAPALALGAEPPEPHLMDEPPRPRSGRLLDRWLLARSYGYLGVIEAAVSMAAFVGVWLAHGFDFAGIRAALGPILDGTVDPDTLAVYREATTATLWAIVACQVGNVFACRSERLSAFTRRGADNPLLRTALAVELAIIAAIVFLPPLQQVFGTLPPGPAMLLVTAFMAPILLLVFEEARKWMVRSTLLGRRAQHDAR